MLLVSVRIEGTTPLLLNKFTDEAAMAATNGSRLSIKGDPGTPHEQAEKKLYIGNSGDLIMPSPNMLACLIGAGVFFKVGRSKLSTAKSSLIPACLEISEVEIPIVSKEGWSVDTRAVRIPSTGGRILCHRPSFNDWALEFGINIDTEMINEKLVRELVDAAGKKIGLGDFRPSCRGPFGKFVVTSWVADRPEKHEVNGRLNGVAV